MGNLSSTQTSPKPKSDWDNFIEAIYNEGVPQDVSIANHPGSYEGRYHRCGYLYRKHIRSVELFQRLSNTEYNNVLSKEPSPLIRDALRKIYAKGQSKQISKNFNEK